MPKDHWIAEETDSNGCQHSSCFKPATLQWQRHSTQAEIDDLRELYRRTGVNLRAQEHYTAVFACDEHALPPEEAWPIHEADCPAPDPGCPCGS